MLPVRSLLNFLYLDGSTDQEPLCSLRRAAMVSSCRFLRYNPNSYAPGLNDHWLSLAAYSPWLTCWSSSTALQICSTSRNWKIVSLASSGCEWVSHSAPNPPQTKPAGLSYFTVRTNLRRAWWRNRRTETCIPGFRNCPWARVWNGQPTAALRRFQADESVWRGAKCRTAWCFEGQNQGLSTRWYIWNRSLRCRGRGNVGEA